MVDQLSNSESSFSKDPEILQLQGFVRDLKKVLKDVVNYPRPAIAGRHHKRLRKMWADAVSPNDKFDEIIKSLGEEYGNSNNESKKEKLKELGLTGAPLKFKLGIFNKFRDDYLDYGTAKQGQFEPRSWWVPWRKIFSKLLKSGSLIIGSTMSEIPCGEYIKELIESIDLALDIGWDNE